MSEESRAIDVIADAAVAEYLRRANKTALENMISLCLHAMSPRELADFLRAQAEFIENDLV